MVVISTVETGSMTRTQFEVKDSSVEVVVVNVHSQARQIDPETYTDMIQIISSFTTRIVGVVD